MLIQCRSARCISVADSSETTKFSADDTATRETASLPSGFSPFLAPRQFEENRNIQAVTRFSRLQDEKFSGRSLDTVASATNVSAWCCLVSPRSLLGTVISRCGHSVDGLDRNSGHVHHVLLVATEVAGIPRVGRLAVQKRCSVDGIFRAASSSLLSCTPRTAPFSLSFGILSFLMGVCRDLANASVTFTRPSGYSERTQQVAAVAASDASMNV